MQDQKHHYLIAAEIVFKHKDQEEISAIRINGVLIQDEKNLPTRSLGRAQQVAQMNFHNQMGAEMVHLQVIDVALISLSYLGLMAQEEFQRHPPGMTVQSREEPVAPLETVVAEAGAVAGNDSDEAGGEPTVEEVTNLEAQ